MESAAQGKIFFWDVPKPETEEGNFSVPESKDPLLSFMWMIESQLILDGEMHLENILLPLWCRIHNSPHSEFTCSVCEMAINQVRNQFGMPTLSEEECIINRLWGAHLTAEFRRTYEQDIALASDCEKDQLYVDDTSAPEEQCITVDSLPCLAPKKEYHETKVEELVENTQTMIKEDPGVEQAIKGEDDSFLDELSLMLQKEILETELQEVSNGLIEEDNQVDMLSEPRYEEQLKGALEDFITVMLFEEMLKDLVEETQMESLPNFFQDKQVIVSDMIHHQLRPPETMLEDKTSPEIILDRLEELFEAQSLKETLIFEDMLTKFHEDAWFMQDISVKTENLELFKGALRLFQEELPNQGQHVVDARGIVHHQWRPPKAAGDLASDNTVPSEPEICQVVSFLNPSFESYYDFDYGDFGKTTCIWIDHGPNELPQLIILSENLLEYEKCMVRVCLSVFKDEFARLRTITFAMLLLHNLRNHVKSCTYFASLSRVESRSLVYRFRVGFLFVSLVKGLLSLVLDLP